MLYFLLKLLFRITNRVFFGSIAVRNRDRVPSKGPLLIVSNHPSSFMDSIVIATMISRKFYFLAKGVLFKGKFGKWILPKFNMIPIMRKQDNPDELWKNEATFDRCYEHLGKGDAIVIFPEGISMAERSLHPVKTGAARIALGAEEKFGFELPLQILPIGLNYDNPHKFNRDLFVEIGELIDVRTYRDKFNADPQETVRLLTSDIRRVMEATIINVQHKEMDELLRNIELVYKQKLKSDLEIETGDQPAAFDLTKNMVAALNYFETTDPDRVKNSAERIRTYLQNVRTMGFREGDMREGKKQDNLLLSLLGSFLLIISGFPFYVYGLLNNYLPFKIPGWLANSISKQQQFRGAVVMSLGTLTFAVFYAMQIWLAARYFNQAWIPIAYALSLPATGYFALWYYYTVARIRARWIMLRLFYTRRDDITNLIHERNEIIAMLDNARAEYNQNRLVN